jgi:hypothetical protein
MKCSQKQIKTSIYLSSIFMMLTLAWLTVSLPFVNAAQQATEQQTSTDMQDAAEDDDNPFANTSEEKTPNNFNSISEEYLHDSHSFDQYVTVPSVEYRLEHVPIYIAFHGELISPPPDLS